MSRGISIEDADSKNGGFRCGWIAIRIRIIIPNIEEMRLTAGHVIQK